MFRKPTREVLCDGSPGLGSGLCRGEAEVEGWRGCLLFWAGQLRALTHAGHCECKAEGCVDGQRPPSQICEVIWEGSVVIEVGSKAARANDDALSLDRRLLAGCFDNGRLSLHRRLCGLGRRLCGGCWLCRRLGGLCGLRL